MTRERRIHVGAWLVIGAFALLYAPVLDSLQHIIDEGQNVYAARRIQHGEVPFRDFFLQQPPLYVYAVALLPTSHLWPARLLSLLAAAATGYGVFRLGRRIFGADSTAPLVALALFLFSGLQYYELLAMPNACMLLLALVAAWLLLARSRGRGPAVAAGVCLALAILAKPLALALYPAFLCAFGGDPAGRRRLLSMTAAMAVVGLGAWAFWHVQSDGAFTELVRLQGSRMLRRPTIESYRELPGFRTWIDDASALGFTFRAYRDAFLGANGLLVLGGLAGIPVLLRGAQVRREERILWIAWLAFSLLFSLLVWDVAYEHYHVLYLPPLALLTALSLRRFAAPGGWRRAVCAGLLLAFAAAGVLSVRLQTQDYAPALALRGERAPLLAFDPTVNVLSETGIPCGVVGFPLPPYGRHLDGRGGDFESSAELLVRCLEATPEARIAIHHLSGLAFVMIDRTLYDYITRQDPQRVVFLTDRARELFLGLYPPGGADGAVRQGDVRLLDPHF